jgi:ABC-type molybdate transport system substrate-binding protein
MKPRSLARWLFTLGMAALLIAGAASAADELGRRGLVRADSKVELARSMVGMVVRTGTAKPDIGIMDVPGVNFVGTIPAELQPGFSCAGALTSKAQQPEAARALIRFLSSPDAAPAILKAGLTPPPGR